MQIYKKILIGTFLGSSFAAYANAAAAPTNTTESATPIGLTVPNLEPGFEFNASVLWLQPNGNQFYSVLTTPFPIQTPNWENKYIDPNYSPAFNIGARYIFANKGQDVQINWTHLDSSDSASTVANDSIGQFAPPSYESGPDGGLIDVANSSVNFNYDSVNFDIGQYLQFGADADKALQLRLFTGLNYSYIKENLSTEYTNKNDDFSVNQNNTSQFQGVGPRAGVHANYGIGHGFGVVGQFATAILIGELKDNTTYNSASSELENGTNYQFISTPNRAHIVPEFEGKFGLSYEHNLDDNLFTIEAGYQAAIYIDAIEQTYPAAVTVPIESGVVDATAMEVTQNDFTVNGPYIGLSWKPSAETAGKTTIPATSIVPPIAFGIPNLASGFELTAAALWLRPHTSNLLYGTLESPLPLESPSWNNEYIEPGFTPAFNIGATYTFANTGNDVQLNWTHLDSSDSNSTNADLSINQFIAPIYSVDPQSVGVEVANGSVDFNYDTVNFDFGQYYQFGNVSDEALQVRLFGGLNYTYIKENRTTNYTNYAGSFNSNSDAISKYQGIGPRIGIHSDYGVGNGIGVVGQFATSILLGEKSASASSTFNIGDEISTNQDISIPNSTQVVPAFDGNIGVRYEHAIAEDLFTIEAGYQAAIYFNAITESYPTSVENSIETEPLTINTMGTEETNFAVSGPYVSLSWKPSAGTSKTTTSTASQPFIPFGVPDLKPGLELNGYVLWLKPNADNLLYGVVTNPGAPESWNEEYIDPGYTASFNLGARYIIPKGRDIQLNWTHMDSNDSDSTQTNAATGQTIAPSYAMNDNGVNIESANSSINFNYDSVNLDIGQYLQYGSQINHQLQTRFFGGLNYSHIKQNWVTDYNNNSATFNVSQDSYSEYNGVGPRVGIHTDYGIGSGFGIVGQVAGSVLIGEMKNNISWASQAEELRGVTNYQGISTGNTTQVVPALDGKLGLNYTHQVNDNIVTLEAGYQAAIYVNAINQAYPTSVVDPIDAGTIAVDTMGTSQSNFSVMGPYLGLSWKM